MEERSGESEDRGFLPPEPAGPEPELGGSPARPPQPQAPHPQAPGGAQPPGAQPGAQPPGAQPGAQPPGAQPPGYAYPPPPGQAPPPGQPPGYGYPPPPPGQAYPPPPGYGYPPGATGPPGYAYPPPWGYPQQSVPDNGPAVAGFVFSLVAGGLLIISGGFSSIISIACAIVGIVYSRKGKRKVDAGETPKHRGLAQAGFIIGWVSLGLSVLATIAWTLILAFAIADEDWDWGTDPDTVRVTAVALRAGAQFIGV
jgi:hypothetical protein